MKPLRRWVIALALLGATVLAAAGTWAYFQVRRLDHELVERFSGKRWEIPSKIYSDSFVANVGGELSPLKLVERLDRLEYRRVDGDVEHAGEYRYRPSERRIDVYLRNFHYPNRVARGFPARLEIAENRVSEILRLDSGESIDGIELEPEILAGIYTGAAEERRVVHIQEIPKILVQAVLAAEDHRFFEHHGIDGRGVLRAMLANLRSGRVVQGGSTLTQQLIKNFFLSSTRSFERKVTEAVMAVLAEIHYSKLEILETYLNEIYLGQRGSRGIYGVWEGSQFYFGKELRDLTIAEAAMLAGIIRGPSHLAPNRNPEPARRRRDEVLATLRENGEISPAEYEQAIADQLPERVPSTESTGAPYFVDYVRSQLEAEVPSNTLASEGFRIFTTLDPSLQRDAERAVHDGLAALERARPRLAEGGEPVEALLLAVQPHSGEIKVMVGGRSYDASQFNRVSDARRQPGSVFKPIVLLAAMEDEEQKGSRRFLPTRKVLDAPFTWTYDGQSWSPENYKGEYHGEVTIRQALERSLNAATARIAQEVGIDHVREVASRIGFDDLPALPALALGGVEVSALEVARSFATIANLGFRAETSAIRSVVDGEGNPIVRTSLGASQAVSPRVAYLVTHLMEGVVDRGTARAVRAAGIRFPVAGKTGTTNDGRDAWFVGFTPDLLAVVWVGFDRDRALGLSGAEAALPLWIEFMKSAYAGSPATAFLVPPGIVSSWIDPASGELATARCPVRLEEAFLEGEAPSFHCPLHPDSGAPVEPPHLPIDATPGSATPADPRTGLAAP